MACKTKYPEPDSKEFYMTMRSATLNSYELGIVTILELTGMHVSALVSLTDENLKGQNIRWRRPKTFENQTARVPKGDLPVVQGWILTYGNGRRTDRAIRYALQRIGERVGFPDVSPMTYRHQRAVVLLDDGMSPHEVAHILGCTLGTLEKHYAQVKADRRTL